MSKTIQAALSGQKLTLTGCGGIYSDSEKYLRLSFTLPDDYAACDAGFLFRQGGQCYTVIYEGEYITVPHEVIRPPCFFVSLVLTDSDGLRLTTGAERIEVAMSGYEEGISPAAPTPDVYTEIINRLHGATNSPFIGSNGSWQVYDNESGEYEDSGIQAKGDKGDTGATGATGNVMFATFEVDSNMELVMTTPDGYSGATFSLNNGTLEVTV